MADGHKRPLTTFDIVNQCLMVDYEDPADLPKTRTTYDGQRQNLMVDYEDPADLPKTKTTYDAAVEALTVEYPPVAIGIVAYDRRRLRLDRTASGECVTCGYNLTGNTSGVCPECGTPTTAGVKA